MVDDGVAMVTVAGIHFPYLLLPFYAWLIVQLCSGFVACGWVVRRRDNPAGYWLSVTVYVAFLVAATAMFNR